MQQAPPELGRTVTDRDELAVALGLEPGTADLPDGVVVAEGTLTV